MFKYPEEYRIAGNPGSSGAFVLTKNNVQFRMVASAAFGWEHVSITLNKKRCPDWEEMCRVKDIFWDEEDCVVQYHPSKKENINNHPTCLHLWRPITETLPLPPSDLVGVKMQVSKE